MTPQAALLRRRLAARRATAAAGFDALLVTEKLNHWYLTGHRSTEFDKKSRPHALLLPASGEAWLVAPAVDAEALRSAWPEARLVTYVDVPLPPALLAEAVRDAGLGGARIAAEFAPGERLGVSLEELDTLRAAVPGLSLVSAGPLLQRLRMVKDPEEIAAIRAACDVTLRAWEATLGALRPGMPDAAVAALLGAELCRAGHDFNVPGHVSVGDGAPGRTSYREGDVLWCDFGATVGGYQADVSRRAVFGRATAAQSAEHATACAVLDAMLEAIRPGVRACDVAAVAEAMLVAAGHPPLGGRRVGHGLGLSAAEGPSLALHDKTVLLPGMVLTPEPGWLAADGRRVHVEETVLVTASGCERLSTGVHALPEIPCGAVTGRPAAG